MAIIKSLVAGLALAAFSMPATAETQVTIDLNHVARVIYCERVLTRPMGVRKDLQEGWKWLRLSAEHGYADAQLYVGWAYRDGNFVIEDYVEAMKWFRLGAKQGENYSQNALGGMYRDGKGVPQDYVRAHMWFNLAGRVVGGRNNREAIEKLMTPQQIAEAQKLAREWKPDKD
jgi:uncharacterized protein